ncbi:hypothetical protein G9A89_023330 [Geosiphon pyriformis]|nr:hypothetical protein G9A89_023330 [Geosiphon pyriformis]
MKPVGSSAKASDSVSAGLRTCLNAKKNCLNTVYFCDMSYKKPKKHVAGIIVNLSTGLLSLEDISSNGIKFVVFWDSKVGSIANSISNLSDVKNMVNTVVEETSYAKSDEDDDINKVTPRKTHTRMYVLENLPKQPSFSCMNDDNNELVIPPWVILGSNKPPLIDINKAKKLAIHKKIVVNNDLKRVSSHSDKEIVVKEILVDLLKLAVKSPTDEIPVEELTFTANKNKFKVTTTPDTTTLEYYQSIYTYCKQRFNIPDGIEVVKKSVYQYIENHINNYLFGNYNISEVKSNLYNNLAHYSQLGTEDLNSETLATYFHELNFNIIKYCEETYSVQSQYTIDFESETETSNKGKNKLKQYSRTTPNTPTLPKTTAKYLQTSEQGTSSKLPLIITPFLASLAQAQTPNSPLNRFAKPEDFTSLRSPTRQQEPLQTSSNLLDFLAENQSEHSETAANEENNSEITEEESIDSENKEDEMTTYIAKIPEFNGEDIETSLQEWLDQVTKAGDANGWNAARIYLTMPEEQDFHHIASSEGRAAAQQQQNPSHNHTTIPPARITENANLSDIFPFEFEANELPFLLSNATANEQKAITAMYAEAKVEGKPIHLILNSGSVGSIITYQLMQQLKRNVDRPAQTVIVTADGMKKTPVGEIDNFLFTLDGITIPVKVLVMDAPQYQALIGNDWL